MAVDRDRVAALVRQLLEAIGEDPERPGLKLTPDRVADAYVDFFAGVGEDASAPLAHTISVSQGPAPETLPSGAVMLRDTNDDTDRLRETMVTTESSVSFDCTSAAP